MKRWEHKAIEIRYDRLINDINEQGIDGWELVQVGQPYQHLTVETPGEDIVMYHVVWFKRKLP